VTQQAPPVPVCTYSISPTSGDFTSSGGTGSITVTATSGCSWTASESVDWIAITSGSSGSGNGTVSYTVTANTGTSSRSATITVVGWNHTVTQQPPPPVGLIFNFNSNNQGWNRAGFYDSGGLTQIAGYFQNLPVGWTNGVIYIGSDSLTLPPSPSGDTWIHWDFNSPDLSSDVLWNGATSFTYDISGANMTGYTGDSLHPISVQAVLHVRRPDLTESYFTDAQFHPIPLGSLGGWSTQTVNISALGMPVGTVILNINLRIFFQSSSSIGGHIMLDNVIPQ
jgi:hypothetical protein